MERLIVNKLILIFLHMLIANHCFAHTGSTSYLFLEPQGNLINAEWKIPLSDLDRVLDLDLDLDNQITRTEVQLSAERIRRYAFSTLITKQHQKNCRISGDTFRIDRLDTKPAVYLDFRIDCESKLTEQDTLTLNYRLFHQVNPWHQGIVSVKNQTGTQRFVLSQQRTVITLSENTPDSASFLTFIIEGIWHIYIGLDHILFLMTLIFPIVLGKKNQTRPGSTRTLLKSLFSIVTAFTIAHSITLMLAASQTITLPTQWVESGIALSVIIGAALALYPSFNRWRWSLAFGFGLIHGFGFANVLSDLILPAESVTLHLIAFNIGVELGQLSIVAAVVPLLLMLSRIPPLRYRLLAPGMMTVIGFGMLWLLQRVFGVALNIPI